MGSGAAECRPRGRLRPTYSGAIEPVYECGPGRAIGERRATRTARFCLSSIGYQTCRDPLTTLWSGPTMNYTGQAHLTEYAGSAGLHLRTANAQITLTRVGGASFDFVSIGLSVLSKGGASPPVTFTGHPAGGGTVTVTFTPTEFGFQMFTLPLTFSNLTSVTWNQGTNESNAHQFDNIVIGGL